MKTHGQRTTSTAQQSRDVAVANTSRPILPRLVDIASAANYLGISTWTVRALAANGDLHPVRLPSVRHRDELGRRLLFDIQDLDRAIESWKDSPPNPAMAA